MIYALWTIQLFLALCAVGGIYQFLVVRKCSFSLLLVINTCSILILLLLAAALANLRLVQYALAAVISLYGAEGLVLFGWQRHPAIIIPQVTHVGMIAVSIPLLVLADSPAGIAWLIGLPAGLIVRYVQRRALRMRSDTKQLADDPIVGRVFQRLVRDGRENRDAE